jgi:hypothetical protein
VLRSKTLAVRWLNWTGKKLLLVSNFKDAKAGKEKLVGERENIVGTAVAKGPVAFMRGLSSLIEKLGTLGIVNPRTIAILNKLPKQDKVDDGVISEKDRRTRNISQRERRPKPCE